MVQAAERAYDAIRAGILTGDHAPGARLPEGELATAIGVSRTPVREALHRLDAEGLVSFSPNRGAQVVAFSDRDVDEIYSLRALLEGDAARRAAPRIGPDATDRLRGLADAMEDVGLDPAPAARARIAGLNRDFHATILAAADNRRLEALLGAVVLVPLVHRTFHRYSTEALSRSFHHHRELIAAMEVGDGDWAGAVMRAHVHAARAVLAADAGGRRATSGASARTPADAAPAPTASSTTAATPPDAPTREAS